MTVQTLAEELGLWGEIRTALRMQLALEQAASLESRLATLAVQRSHAVQRLGSYVARGGEPQAIRLQFAQEEQALRATFLHELAHACDHLSNQAGRSYRKAHGRGWQNWMAAFGQPADARGDSAALAALREQRLKVVAVCRDCGAEIRRLRRLDKRRRYVHTACGGKLQPV